MLASLAKPLAKIVEQRSFLVVMLASLAKHLAKLVNKIIYNNNARFARKTLG